MSCSAICRGLEIKVDTVEEEAALYVKYGTERKISLEQYLFLIILIYNRQGTRPNFNIQASECDHCTLCSSLRCDSVETGGNSTIYAMVVARNGFRTSHITFTGENIKEVKIS